MHPVYVVHAVLIVAATIAMSRAAPAVSWPVWAILMTTLVPMTTYVLPVFILWVRGYRDKRLRDEASVLGELGRSYRIALAPRERLAFYLAAMELPSWTRRELVSLDSSQKYSEWLGKDAAQVLRFIATHREAYPTIALDAIRGSGVQDFGRLIEYAEVIGLNAALQALREDMPLEYARVVYA